MYYLSFSPKTLLPIPVEGKATGTLCISKHSHGQGCTKGVENVVSLMPLVITVPGCVLKSNLISNTH